MTNKWMDGLIVAYMIGFEVRLLVFVTWLAGHRAPLS